MKGHRDLERVSAAAVLCALVALLFPWRPLAVLAALSLALLLPGYAILAVAFGPHRPALAQRLVVGVACSFAALALGALLFNYLPGGIRGITWALFLLVLIVACCRGAAVRRGRPERRSQNGEAAAAPAPRLRLPRRDLVLLGAGLLAGAVAVYLVQQPVPAGSAVGFTSMWMLPSQEAKDVVRLGVVSSEQHPARFELKVQGVGSGWEGKGFVLEPGEEKVFRLDVTPGPKGDRVIASLYRAGELDQLYRRVTAWPRS